MPGGRGEAASCPVERVYNAPRRRRDPLSNQTGVEPRVSASRARLILALGAILFGAMAVATRAASQEHGAAQIAFVRFALNLAGVGLWAWLQPGRMRATRPVLLFLRGLFGGSAVLLYFTAIGNLGAGLGTLLNYTFPLWATVFAALFLGERIGGRLLVGMALATGGLVVVVGPGQLSDAVQGLGDPAVRWGLLAGVVSSVLAGAATTVVRAVRQTDSALAVFGAFCLVGAIVCLPGAVADWRPVSTWSGAMLLLAAGLSFVAQMMFTYALKYVQVGAGALTTQLTVVASYGFAAVFLGEAIGAGVLLGGAMTMAGVLLAAPGRTVAVRRKAV